MVACFAGSHTFLHVAVTENSLGCSCVNNRYCVDHMCAGVTAPGKELTDYEICSLAREPSMFTFPVACFTIRMWNKTLIKEKVTSFQPNMFEEFQ